MERRQKTEGKKFLADGSERGMCEFVSVPQIRKIKNLGQAKSRIYSVLTRMRSDRARCKS